VGGVILGKLVFGKDAFGYGLELCLRRAGLVAHAVTPATARGCDLLLVSMFWYANVYELEAFMRHAGIRKGSRPYLLAGGMQATMAPEIILGLVDGVFVGDADDCLGEIVREIEATGSCSHPSVYAGGGVPEPRVCAPTAFAIQTLEQKGVLRCEIARGCRYKCAFCALSGLKPYQEVPFSDLEPVIRRAARRRCSFFAPERTRHSEWQQIKSALTSCRCGDMGQDARLESLQEVAGASVTFGVEGLSERLRRSVGKPFPDGLILDRLGQFVATRKNVARVAMYFIAGLPGEAEEDWQAAWTLFERIGEADWSRRLVLCPVLNPLSPKRFTKLGAVHIDLFADYAARWQRLLRRDGGQWGFRIVETLVWGVWERLLDAIVQRGGVAGAEVVRRMPEALLTRKPPMPERRRLAMRLLATCAGVGITREQLEGPESGVPPPAPLRRTSAPPRRSRDGVAAC
jgi:hypothetical protein